MVENCCHWLRAMSDRIKISPNMYGTKGGMYQLKNVNIWLDAMAGNNWCHNFMEYSHLLKLNTIIEINRITMGTLY